MFKLIQIFFKAASVDHGAEYNQTDYFDSYYQIILLAFNLTHTCIWLHCKVLRIKCCPELSHVVSKVLEAQLQILMKNNTKIISIMLHKLLNDSVSRSSPSW